MNPLVDKPSILWLEMVKSTNVSVRRQISSLDNLSVTAARCQSAGRGQGDHTWFSSPGKNLTFSILCRFPAEGAGRIDASAAVTITQLCSLAVTDYLSGHGVHGRIKWPNDVWVEDRKICGMLIENSIMEGRVDWSIAGIGLNLNEKDWPSDLPNPVALGELTGEEYSTDEELERLCDAIAARYRMAFTASGREQLERDFNALVFHLQK